MHECEPAVPLLRNSDDSEEDFAEFDSGGRLLDSVSESTEVGTIIDMKGFS